MQGRVQNPVEHLRWIVKGLVPLTIFVKKLHLRYSTGFWICLWDVQSFMNEKGLQLHYWETHLINLAAKIVCVHEECEQDIFAQSTRSHILLFIKQNNGKHEYVNIYHWELELKRAVSQTSPVHLPKRKPPTPTLKQKFLLGKHEVKFDDHVG